MGRFSSYKYCRDICHDRDIHITINCLVMILLSPRELYWLNKRWLCKFGCCELLQTTVGRPDLHMHRTLYTVLSNKMANYYNAPYTCMHCTHYSKSKYKA